MERREGAGTRGRQGQQVGKKTIEQDINQDSERSDMDIRQRIRKIKMFKPGKSFLENMIADLYYLYYCYKEKKKNVTLLPFEFKVLWLSFLYKGKGSTTL